VIETPNHFLERLHSQGIPASKVLKEVELGFTGWEGNCYGYLAELEDGTKRLYITEFKKLIEVDEFYFEKRIRHYQEWIANTQDMLNCYRGV